MIFYNIPAQHTFLPVKLTCDTHFLSVRGLLIIQPYIHASLPDDKKVLNRYQTLQFREHVHIAPISLWFWASKSFKFFFAMHSSFKTRWDDYQLKDEFITWIPSWEECHHLAKRRWGYLWHNTQTRCRYAEPRCNHQWICKYYGGTEFCKTIHIEDNNIHT